MEAILLLAAFLAFMFLGMPVIPPPKPKAPKKEVDLDKIARLKQKMREQGMLPPEE